MITVLSHGIAVYLGGFPTPCRPRSIWEADNVYIGLDRALGYPDAVERRQADAERDEEWMKRFIVAGGKLCRHIGLREASQLNSEETLTAFTRMLDHMRELERSWPMPSDLLSQYSFQWFVIDAEMDNWIRWAGLSPETIRRKAQDAQVFPHPSPL